MSSTKDYLMSVPPLLHPAAKGEVSHQGSMITMTHFHVLPMGRLTSQSPVLDCQFVGSSSRWVVSSSGCRFFKSLACSIVRLFEKVNTHHVSRFAILPKVLISASLHDFKIINLDGIDFRSLIKEYSQFAWTRQRIISLPKRSDRHIQSSQSRRREDLLPSQEFEYVEKYHILQRINVLTTG